MRFLLVMCMVLLPFQALAFEEVYDYENDAYVKVYVHEPLVEGEIMEVYDLEAATQAKYIIRYIEDLGYVKKVEVFSPDTGLYRRFELD